MITASNPARFSSAPQYPPTSASPNPPVKGDFAPTAWRPLPGTGVPVRMPGTTTSGFSGANGPTPFGVFFSSSWATKPQPPRYSR